MKTPRLPLSFVLVGLAAAVWIPSLAAQPVDYSSSVRIDLNAERDGIELLVGDTSKGARATNSEWRAEKAPYWITAHFPSSHSEWKTGSITFTPEASGTVVLQLKGPLVRETGTTTAKPVLVQFDDFRITGSTLANSGFEDYDGDRVLEWYRPPAPANTTPALLARVGTERPASGRAYAIVWHNSALHQAIQVVKSQPVTLTFKHRLQRLSPAP